MSMSLVLVYINATDSRRSFLALVWSVSCFITFFPPFPSLIFLHWSGPRTLCYTSSPFLPPHTFFLFAVCPILSLRQRFSIFPLWHTAFPSSTPASNTTAHTDTRHRVLRLCCTVLSSGFSPAHLKWNWDCKILQFTSREAWKYYFGINISQYSNMGHQ